MTEPLLDVVIPCHDNVAWLKMCLTALHAWTEHPYHVWIVDNASEEEETKEFLAADYGYDGQHPQDGSPRHGQVTVLHRGVNDSFSNSVNEGVAAGSAKNVVILNSDAIVQPGWDRAVLEDLAHADVGMTGLRTNNASGPQAQPNVWPLHAGPSLVGELQGREVDTVSAPLLIFFGVALRREVWDKIGPLDGKTCQGWGGSEDLDYSWRLIDAGYRLVISRGYALHGCSKTYEARGIKAEEKAALELKNQDALFRKHVESRARRGVRSSQLSIAICTFHGSEETKTRWAHSMIGAMQPLLTSGVAVQFMMSTRTMIAMAREHLAREAVKLTQKRLQDGGGKTIDYVVMSDDDHTFPTDAILRLVLANKPIVGAWAYKRSVNVLEPTKADHTSCVFRWTDPEKREWVVSTEGLEKTGLRKVDAIGFGLVAIRMDVLVEMVKRADLEKKNGTGSGRMFEFASVGEDIGFCKKATEAGFEIWCDTDLVIGHFGAPVIVDYEYAKRWRQEAQAQGGLRREVDLP